ncbi:MAG: hypothetical protein ACF788_08575 [Novipirellula sp. JB048]
MQQIKGLWRDTWWLWLGFVGLLVAMSALLSWAFLLIIPLLHMPFLYFAFVRYDDDGNEKINV